MKAYSYFAKQNKIKYAYASLGDIWTKPPVSDGFIIRVLFALGQGQVGWEPVCWSHVSRGWMGRLARLLNYHSEVRGSRVQGRSGGSVLPLLPGGASSLPSLLPAAPVRHCPAGLAAALHSCRLHNCTREDHGSHQGSILRKKSLISM